MKQDKIESLQAEKAKLEEQIAQLRQESETLRTKWLSSLVNATSYDQNLKKNIDSLESDPLFALVDFYTYHHLGSLPAPFQDSDLEDLDFHNPIFLDWFLSGMLNPTVVEDVLSLVDVESFAFFQKTLEDKQEITYTPFQGLKILVKLGLLFLMEEDERFFLFTTEEVKQVVQQLDLVALNEKQEKNQRILALACAAALLYGDISLTDLYEILENYGFPPGNSVAHFSQILEKLIEKNEDFSLVREGHLSHQVFGEFPGDLLPLIQAQKGKPRYVPSGMAAFLDEGTEDFQDPSPQRGAMFDFIASYQKDEIALDNVMFMLDLGCAHDHALEELLVHVNEYKSFPPKKTVQSKFLDLLIEMDYHSKKWVHNGFSPCELDQKYGYSLGRKAKPQAFLQTEGPSKNGPCPCGSGKKYKRCCGK